MRPFCLQPPHAPHRRFLTLPLSAMGFPCGSGLRPWSVGSPKHQAESSSSVCGPVSHLRLLPTPPRGDAVIFGSRPESVGLKRICTSLNECAHGRTDRRRPRRRSGARKSKQPAGKAHEELISQPTPTTTVPGPSEEVSRRSEELSGRPEGNSGSSEEISGAPGAVRADGSALPAVGSPLR